MWLILAFAALGFLIGNLIGFSASSTVPSFLGLLFTLLGGSLIALLNKLDEPNRKMAGQVVFALALACLVGVYSSVVINERQLLTPKERRFLSNSAELRSKYLAAEAVSDAARIDWMRRSGKLTLEQAYDQLLESVENPSSRGANHEH
jgi:hypothetical protein